LSEGFSGPSADELIATRKTAGDQHAGTFGVIIALLLLARADEVIE
jgi:hypothetical protein